MRTSPTKYYILTNFVWSSVETLMFLYPLLLIPGLLNLIAPHSDLKIIIIIHNMIWHQAIWTI